MDIRNFKKAIFFVCSLINLFPSSKAFALKNIEGVDELNKFSNTFIKIENKFIEPPSKVFFKKYHQNFNESKLLSILNQKKNELEIKSEKQSEENNILYAEGNVVVSFEGNILKADSISYDKANKKITAKGNIALFIGKQILKSERFQYDFLEKKGYLIKVQGLISTDNLINDLYSNFDSSDIKKVDILQKIEKDKVLNTPNEVKNWIFFTEKLEIDDGIWKTDRAVFTNDLLDMRQVKIVINSLQIRSKEDNLRFKSSLNYLILDENLSIPFWFGDRTLSKSGDNFTFLNRWNLGFDNVDKDGYFVGRKFNSIDLSDSFILDLEPQYLIQRSLKGYTKSFVNKGDSITSDKVKRDTTFKDYFALNAQVKGNIKKWDLLIDKQINSFDPEKFSDAIRVKSSLSKEINFLNLKWNKSFYGVYRDRIWNGSMGEAELYGGYGSKIERKNTWKVNGINKTETLSIGLGRFKGEALNSKDLVSSYKGSVFYSLDQKFSLTSDKSKDKFIDNSYEYIFEPIDSGIYLNTQIAASYSKYNNGNHQEYIGIGAGPEIIFGNFKKKAFDYTRISLLPYYKFRSGESIFKFDQIYDEFTLDIAFDQQLFGPILIKSSASLNLDKNSKDYGDFINSKISINWKKRSYQFGIFYQPLSQSGGIKFTLFGFK